MLVAIAIPVFITQLEKSRDSVSVSNLRTAYAQAQTGYLSYVGQATGSYTDGDVTVTVNADKKITTIAIANVKITTMTSSNDWSGEALNLPWWSDTQTPADGGSGVAGDSKTITFTYSTDDATLGDITGVAIS